MVRGCLKQIKGGNLFTKLLVNWDAMAVVGAHSINKRGLGKFTDN